MTQQETNQGWEEKLEAVREHLEHESIWFYPYTMLMGLEAKGLLTPDECERAKWKIELIGPFLRLQVLNMIKGTVKYPHDDWDTETWRRMGRDDKVDAVNYDLLFEYHMVKEGLL